MKLLYITRKYPPMVGGMEKVNYALSEELSKRIPTTRITWGRSQKYLIFFLTKAFLQSLFIIPHNKITHVHLGDGLLAPLGVILKLIFKVSCSATVHGLDITYTFRPYQIIVPRSLALLDKIICVSRATKEECVARGIPADKIGVIPNGVYPNEFKTDVTREELGQKLKVSLLNKKILITVGRLVKRKGVYWFIEHVLSKLNESYVYLIIGSGPEKMRIQSLIAKLNLHKRAHLLGRVSGDTLKTIYNTADLFVMPNIAVTGDIEGFGIVAIEASSTGLPVLASNLDGVSDAVIDDKYLLPQDPKQWKENIQTLSFLTQKERKVIQEKTNTLFGWDSIADEYTREFRNL